MTQSLFAKLPKYVINLPLRMDRLQYFFSSNSHIKCDFTVVEAVYGKSLSVEELENQWYMNSCRDYYKIIPSPGQIGCTLSHFNLYKQIAADPNIGDDQWVLIAEDDTILVKDFESRIESILLTLAEERFSYAELVVLRYGDFHRSLDYLPSLLQLNDKEDYREEESKAEEKIFLDYLNAQAEQERAKQKAQEARRQASKPNYGFSSSCSLNADGSDDENKTEDFNLEPSKVPLNLLSTTANLRHFNLGLLLKANPLFIIPTRIKTASSEQEEAIEDNPLLGSYPPLNYLSVDDLKAEADRVALKEQEENPLLDSTAEEWEKEQEVARLLEKGSIFGDSPATQKLFAVTYMNPQGSSLYLIRKSACKRIVAENKKAWWLTDDFKSIVAVPQLLFASPNLGYVNPLCDSDIDNSEMELLYSTTRLNQIYFKYQRSLLKKKVEWAASLYATDVKERKSAYRKLALTFLV